MSTLGFWVDLLIWDWAWVSIVLSLALLALALPPRGRAIALASFAWALGGGLFWIAACHVIDWLDRGVWLLALPVAYVHEFGSGFFFVGTTALVVYFVRKPSASPPSADAQNAL